MNFLPLALAERIIAAADRNSPADGVLRQVFKSERGLDGEARREISDAVFAYFRWYRWLEEKSSIREKIESAYQLAAKFSIQPADFSDSELVARAVPDWIHQELEVTPAWARALQSEPVLWLRARPGQGRGLANELGDCSSFGQGPLAEALRYAGQTDLFRTAAFHAGRFELQDISSQAVGLICAPEPKQTWWDACAGEGGKMLHLSDLMRNQGLIWASDRAAWRLQSLKRRAARAKVFNYRTVGWNGEARLPTRTKFDGVLVDAPCSGVGTWHRNPHARWTTTMQDVFELSRLQQQLLMNAAPAVKSGGRLVYAACTLTGAETGSVVAAFERACPDFARIDFHNPLSGEAAAGGQVCYWPQQFGGNGMFIAVWRRQ
jgi:16S rRNA (cytosine967-C5)-methyltransferase